MNEDKQLQAIVEQLQSCVIKPFGDYIQAYTMNNELLMSLVPCLDTRARNIAMLVERPMDVGDGEDFNHVKYELVSVIVHSDKLMITGSTGGHEQVSDVSTLISRFISGWYDQELCPVNPIFTGYGGGRVTQAGNGSILFGLANTPILIYRQPAGHGDEMVYKVRGYDVAIEISHQMKAQLALVAGDDKCAMESLMAIALGVLPRAFSMYKSSMDQMSIT